MAILSSTNLLAAHTLYTLTLSYLLLTNPASIASTPLISTLGASLRLPSASTASPFAPPTDPAAALDALATPNAATAIAALLLAFLALTDLINASLPDPVFGAVWSAQAPVRLMVLFALEAWIYLSRPGVEVDAVVLPVDGVGGVGRGVAGWLVCDVVFGWGFVELVWMFWVFVVLREERGVAVRKEAEKKAAATAGKGPRS